jgi:hypothetical protein
VPGNIDYNHHAYKKAQRVEVDTCYGLRLSDNSQQYQYQRAGEGDDGFALFSGNNKKVGNQKDKNSECSVGLDMHFLTLRVILISIPYRLW